MSLIPGWSHHSSLQVHITVVVRTTSQPEGHENHISSIPGLRERDCHRLIARAHHRFNGTNVTGVESNNKSHSEKHVIHNLQDLRFTGCCAPAITDFASRLSHRVPAVSRRFQSLLVTV